MTKAPFLGVATSSKGLLQEESNLLTVHTSDGLDPDIYKLMEESGKTSTNRHLQGTSLTQNLMGPMTSKKLYRNKVTEL